METKEINTEELKRSILSGIAEISDDIDFIDKINKMTFAFLKNAQNH